MAFDAHANLAYSVVAVAPAPALSGTSLTLSAGEGALMPAAPFNATVWAAGAFPLTTNAEIVRVTAVVGDVLTIIRAQEGTAARAILVGDQFANTISAKVITDLETSIVTTNGLLSAINVSAGTTSNNLSALTFSNSNGVSFGLNGSVITGTVATNYLTTAMASNRGSDFVQATAVFAGTNASGTIASNGISVSVDAGGTGGHAIRGIAANGSTASTNTVLFADSNGVSFGFGAAGDSTVLTATVRTDYQSAGAYLTTAALSQDSSEYAGTNGAITGGSITVNTSGVSVNLPAYLTTAMQSNAVTLSNIRVSAGTTSNLLSALTFSNSNGLAFGLDGSTITGSYTVPTQSVQTQNMVALSLSGNTDGVLALISSGTAFLAGGNNITLSQDGQSITISGANAGGAQTAISGIVVSDATYTSGTVSFSNQANITIGSSVDGVTQYIRLSGNPAQTVQTQSLIAGVFDGAASISTGTIRLTNANGVTFSINGQTLSASVNTSYLGSNASTNYVQANAAFAGTNATGTIASDGISVSVAAPVAQTNQTVGLYVSSNTYLTSSGTVDARSLTFRGDKSITIGVSAGEVLFSVGAYLTTAALSNHSHGNPTLALTNLTGTTASNSAGLTLSLSGNAAQTVQSAIRGFGVSNTGATAGNTGISTGIDWVLAGSSLLTLSQSTVGGGPNTVWMQHPAWLTTAMASNRGSDFVQAAAVFNGTNATGTIASNAISVSVAAPIPIGTAVKAVASIGSTGTITRYAPEDHQHAGVAAFAVTNTGTTAGNTRSQVGTLFLAASGNITASQSTAAAGNDTIWFSVPAQSVQTQSNIQAIYDGANSISTGTIRFTNANGVSFSVNGQTLSGSVATTYLASNASTNYVQANAVFNGTNATGTIASNNISVSVAAQSNQTIGIFASSNTTLTSTGTIDARSFSIRGIGIASIGFSNSELLISVPSGGGGITAINISAGTTSNNLTAVTFSNSNGISFGMDGSTVTANANTVGTATTVTPVASANSVGTVTRWAAEDHRHAGIGGIGISTAGNTAGTTGSQVGTYWLQGGNNITLSQITSNNGSHTLILSGANPPVQFYDNAPVAATGLSNPGQMTLYVFPFTPVNEVFPGNMSVSTVFLNVTQSVSTAATWTNQLSIAFYSSVNSTQLTRVCSGSTSWGTNAGNMNINDSFGGTRWLTIHSSNFDAQPVFIEGVRYWCAIWNRTSNNAGSMSLNLYGYQTLGTSGARSGIMGLGSVVNSTLGWVRFNGIYSATFSTGMPAALAASDINKSVAQVLFLPHVILNNVATNII